MHWILSLLMVVFCSTSTASDFFLIKNPFPDEAKQIADASALPKNNNEYATPLGVTSRCYEGRHYLVLSMNDSGEGYEFTNKKPENAQCQLLKSRKMPIQNQAGMGLGMEQKAVQQLFNIPSETQKATLMYNKPVTKNGVKFDEQVWVDVEFEKQKLTYLKVFTSLTQ